MKQAYKTLTMMIALVFIVSLKAMAIDDDGGIGGDVPIDGGLSLLVAAGVGYGMKKVRSGRKAK